jgi:DNA-binding FadR family transcriptional regulator
MQGDIFSAIRSPNPLDETVQRVFGVIRVRLLSPGERLPPERELASQLGVSRSTLRVALQTLAEDGWLEIRRGRQGGSFVARWPSLPGPDCLAELLRRQRDNLSSLLDYRNAVETEAAALAAVRASADERAELEALAALVQRAQSDYEAYRAADVRLHVAIARAAHSSRLLAAVTDVQIALADLLDALIFHACEHVCSATAQHTRIVTAIRDGDSAAAGAAMQQHLAATANVLLPLMAREALTDAAAAGR